MGRVETPDDRPLLDTLGATFSADTPIANLLLALVEQPSFVLRRAPQTATTPAASTMATNAGGAP